MYNLFNFCSCSIIMISFHPFSLHNIHPCSSFLHIKDIFIVNCVLIMKLMLKPDQCICHIFCRCVLSVNCLVNTFVAILVPLVESRFWDCFPFASVGLRRIVLTVVMLIILRVSIRIAHHSPSPMFEPRLCSRDLWCVFHVF